MDSATREAAIAGVAVRQSGDESGREAGSGGTPRYSRRLSDKVLIAFHHACDQGDFEVADQLLQVLEMMLTVAARNHRRPCSQTERFPARII